MFNLMNANKMRVKKSRVFHILAAAIILVALFLCYSQYQNKEDVNYDFLCNFFLVFIGIVISIFTGLFLSTEYLDGTMRNKIIIGHKRSHIYLAHFTTVVVVSLFYELLFLILISAIGIPLVGFHLSSTTNFFYALWMMQLIILANAAIFTFIAILCNNGMLINVLCLLVAFGSYFMTLSLMPIVDAPEYISSTMVVNSNTEQITYVKEKNPNYPSPLKRDISRTLLDIIPQAQSIQIANGNVKNKKEIIFYSVSTTLFFLGLGLFLFEKKELK